MCPQSFVKFHVCPHLVAFTYQQKKARHSERWLGGKTERKKERQEKGKVDFSSLKFAESVIVPA